MINLRRAGEKSHRPPHGHSESSYPTLGSSSAGSGKKRAIGSISAKPLVASYQLSSGLGATTAGVQSTFGSIEMQRRGSETAMYAAGGRQYTARPWGGNTAV